MNHDDFTFTCYVVFTDTNKIWFKWCKKGFQHVQVFKPFANVWIRINPQISHVAVDLYPIERSIEDIVGDCTIVQHCTNINPVHINNTLGYNSCISEVKRIIGMRGITLTPYALYKRLTR